MGFFGSLFENKNKTVKSNILDTTNLDINGDDSIQVAGGLSDDHGGFFEYSRGTDDIQQINTYRKLASEGEIDEVTTDLVNETFIFQRDKRSFELDWLPNTDITDQLKSIIYDEFKNIYNILNFDDIGSELFQSFYTDGRIVFQKVKGENGLSKIIKIDPINIVKVNKIPRRDRSSGYIDSNEIKSFYVYNSSSFKNTNLNLISYSDDMEIKGKKLELDEITYITSGKVDPKTNRTISYLDKAIIPFNQLKMMEQSMLIFRVVRAPMRRAIYLDVSNLGKSKAEAYMRDMAKRFRSKLVYNAETGTYVDKKSVLAMTEDYFIPRFNDGKSTEIQNIDGQSSQDILEELSYLKDKLRIAQLYPKSRTSDDGSVFIYGKNDQIPLDEYRYKKFVDKMRNRFMLSIDDMLKTQLILKNIIDESDWEEIKSSYYWDFTEDNAFVEFKDAEIMATRIETANNMADLVEAGYYSKMWIRKEILKQSDEEIEEIDKQIFKEKSFLEDPDNPKNNVGADQIPDDTPQDPNNDVNSDDENTDDEDNELDNKNDQ